MYASRLRVLPCCIRLEEVSMRRSFGGLLAAGAAAFGLSVLGAGLAGSTVVSAESVSDCPVTYEELKAALVDADSDDTPGLNSSYWAVVVNRGGVVCAVAYSGAQRDSQWL